MVIGDSSNNILVEVIELFLAELATLNQGFEEFSNTAY